MYSIEVKKSKKRQFLVFCAKVAAADIHHRSILWDTAVDQGIIVERPYNEKKLHNKPLFLSREFGALDALACNVKRMAEKITKRDDFYFVVSLPSYKYLIEDSDYCHGDRLYTGGRLGLVRYVDIPGVDEGQIAGDKWDLLPHEVCDYDIFVGEFIDALEEYRQRRGIGYFEIPLRLCEWCDDVFFGKRHDQRFCRRDHSQRWHARNSYLKKKASNT